MPRQDTVASLIKRLEEASKIFELSLNVQQFTMVHETNNTVHITNTAVHEIGTVVQRIDSVAQRIDDRTYRTGK